MFFDGAAILRVCSESFFNGASGVTNVLLIGGITSISVARPLVHHVVFLCYVIGMVHVINASTILLVHTCLRNIKSILAMKLSLY